MFGLLVVAAALTPRAFAIECDPAKYPWNGETMARVQALAQEHAGAYDRALQEGSAPDVRAALQDYVLKEEVLPALKSLEGRAKKIGFVLRGAKPTHLGERRSVRLPGIPATDDAKREYIRRTAPWIVKESRFWNGVKFHRAPSARDRLRHDVDHFRTALCWIDEIRSGKD